MTEPRDRLAADIAAWGEVSGREALADRLIALGWKRLDERPSVLRKAWWRAYDRPLAEHEWVGIEEAILKAAPLDEERLARALVAVDGGGYPSSSDPNGMVETTEGSISVLDYPDEWFVSPRKFAAAIAKAYREDSE